MRLVLHPWPEHGRSDSPTTQTGSPSSRFHAPLCAPGAVASVRTDPPSTSSRLSLSSAKKPTDRLSGDQKGNPAPSVPASARADPDSRERSHKREWPSAVATKAIVRPSGEMASDSGAVVGGVLMSARISESAGVGRRATVSSNRAYPHGQAANPGPAAVALRIKPYSLGRSGIGAPRET